MDDKDGFGNPYTHGGEAFYQVCKEIAKRSTFGDESDTQLKIEMTFDRDSGLCMAFVNDFHTDGSLIDWTSIVSCDPSRFSEENKDLNELVTCIDTETKYFKHVVNFPKENYDG